MSDLSERIDRLEAIEGVRDLLWRYATTVDRLPPIDELADLFTEDAVLINPDRHEGRRAILAYYEGVLTSLESARHHIVNSTITVEGHGRARHRGYFLALMNRGGDDILVYGDYDDLVVRGQDGRWRFHQKGNQAVGAKSLAANAESKG